MRAFAAAYPDEKIVQQVAGQIPWFHNCTLLDKLKDQEDRYAKAYGAGVITIEQLKEYLAPVKEKIFSFENQIAKADLESQQGGIKTFPELNQIEAFTQKTSKALSGNLSFDSKKAIIRNIIDRVVGTRENLQVYGYIPVESNINVFTINRNRRSAKRREIDVI
jgi:site-specific DNA recombinase